MVNTRVSDEGYKRMQAEACLRNAAPELLRAARAYFNNYCQDEADDVDNCVDGLKQHEAAKALQAAIFKAEGRSYGLEAVFGMEG